jgi:hypothetical protein
MTRNPTAPLLIIEGRVITTAHKIHDYYQLGFGADIGLSIYNPFVLIPEMPFDSLLGQTVLRVDDGRETIAIHLLAGARLNIDMRDESYTGPEGLELHVAGSPIVVWRGAE